MSNPHLNTELSKMSGAEKEFENNIRPAAFEQFSGQQQIINNISIFIKACRQRGEALDHILFMAPRDWAKPPLAEL